LATEATAPRKTIILATSTAVMILHQDRTWGRVDYSLIITHNKTMFIVRAHVGMDVDRG
jgi:hypothetical protein